MDTPVPPKKVIDKRSNSTLIQETLTNRQRLTAYEKRTEKVPVELDMEPELPEPVEYLINILYDVGPILSGATDLRALQYSDLQAWVSVCSIKLEGWEARLILNFSHLYLGQFQKTRDGGPVPQIDPTSEDNRLVVANKLRTILDSRVKSTRTKRKR